MHIATEESKFGFDEEALNEFIINKSWELLPNICVKGLMGMASFTDDINQVRSEFKSLNKMFQLLKQHVTSASVLSMGMSADYPIAIQEGSNLVRIGSLLFGARDYSKP